MEAFANVAPVDGLRNVVLLHGVHGMSLYPAVSDRLESAGGGEPN